jgi:hypothetical protein
MVNEYTPEQALEVLISKVKIRDVMLAAQVQAAIDIGKDIAETERSTNRRQKSRTYRKTVPFTHYEALEVAIQVLRAHFIEIPLFINSAALNFKQAALGVPEQRGGLPLVGGVESEQLTSKDEGENKELEVELQTETQISTPARQTFPLEPVAANLIEEEAENLLSLADLLNFTGNPNGDAS